MFLILREKYVQTMWHYEIAPLKYCSNTCFKICIMVLSFHSLPFRWATADRTSHALYTVPGIPVNTSKHPCSISAVNWSSTVLSRGTAPSLSPFSLSSSLTFLVSSVFSGLEEVASAAAVVDGAVVAAGSPLADWNKNGKWSKLSSGDEE